MDRRQFLAGIAAFGGIGCLGDGENDDQPLVSEGTDDDPIDGPVTELLPASEDLDGDWQERETDRDRCKVFASSTDVGESSLRTCAWVLSDTAEAGEAFESRISESRLDKRTSVHDEEPKIGVQAAIIAAGSEIDVIFRDANAVGRVEYELDFDGMIVEDDIPEPEEVVVHAVAMHRQWRD